MRKTTWGKIAKQISEIENLTPSGRKILKSISKTKKRSTVIGITGPLGCGKSTLINALISKIKSNSNKIPLTRPLSRKGRGNIEKIGVLAVDPSSPKSGGALLGDRIRMQEHSLDKNVFIRSMATRGACGGISNAVEGAVKLLDSAGNNLIFVETTGAGQCETAVRNVADVVVLVLTPFESDDIQLLKAGLIEIADVIVINKTDTAGGTQSKKIESLTGVPVIEVSAIKSQGLEKLIQEIKKCLSKSSI
ncbi:MAG: GTP-binding protein [Elusimicrobiota bacterium]